MTPADANSPRQSPMAVLSEYANRAEARAKQPDVGAAPATWSGMVCQLGSRRVIVPVTDVTEVIDLPRITRIPGTLSWFLGLGSLRGRAMPFNDLGGYLFGQRASSSSIRRALVHNVDTGPVGFVVDDLLGVHVEESRLSTQCTFQGETLAVLSLSAIVSDSRFLRVDLESV